jgi:O-antigen/teichoic acid export membrane protein
VTEEDDHRRAKGAAARKRMASGRLLLRNAALTVGAQGLMIATGILAVPLLISGLGVARFGILTLAWVVIGYAGVFDLGLGRALTKLTAEKLGAGEDADIPRLFWTAIVLLAGLGALGAVVVALLAPLLVHDVLNIPASLEGEALAAFYLLAASIPFVVLSAALRGNLEARQRFDLTNAVNVSLSVLSYFGPVVLTLFTDNLAVAVSAVVASRVLATGINLVMCLHVDPALRRERTVDRSAAMPLLRFGGWVTVSSLIGPFVVSVDRFIIGSLLSARAVAYYATPYEAIRQLLVVSMSFSSALFPAYSATVDKDRGSAERVFDRGSRAVFTILFPLTLTFVCFAPEILDLWVGQEFRENSSDVMRWLAAGILANGLTFIAFGLIQSTRPDLVAKILITELPFYLVAFWLFIDAFGVEGAAMAWVFRVTLDAVIQHVALRRLGLIQMSRLRAILLRLLAATACFGAVVQIDGFGARLVVYAATVAAFALLAWTRLLQDDERAGIRSLRSSLVRRASTLGRRSSAARTGV